MNVHFYTLYIGQCNGNSGFDIKPGLPLALDIFCCGYEGGWLWFLPAHYRCRCLQPV